MNVPRPQYVTNTATKLRAGKRNSSRRTMTMIRPASAQRNATLERGAGRSRALCGVTAKQPLVRCSAERT
jgi:hypothetical protein